MRIGNLVIGPKAEIEALPPSIEFTPKRMIGEVLVPYLPNTTVSGYQVIYAEGVEPTDTLYPPNIDAPGTSIGEGYTIVDGREHFQSVLWDECRGGVMVQYRSTPEQQACVAANDGRIRCEAACPAREDYDACMAECAAAFPGQLDELGCLLQVSKAAVDATCGPGRAPGIDQLQVVPSNTPLSLTLGADDIKAGLWVFHPAFAPPAGP